MKKKHVIKILANDMQILKYRKKFIEQILDKEILIERKKKTEIIQQLINNEYPELGTNITSIPSYDYLTGLPLFSLTTEKIDDINSEYNEKKIELDLYKNSTVRNLWLGELEEFEKVYDKWLIDMEQTTSDSGNKKKAKVGDKKVKTDDKKTKVVDKKVIETQEKKVVKVAKPVKVVKNA